MIFNRYAKYYDIFYGKKNYKKECNFLEEIFKEYMGYKPKTILDLGCGTGGHIIPLTERGYRMTGVDASLNMLRLAQEKCNRNRIKAKLCNARLQTFELKKKFDIIICMFSTMDYVVRDSEVTKTLKNIINHMKKNSLFIFDFWNEEAVQRYYSPSRKKLFYSNGKIIERRSRTKIFPSKHTCEVNYTCTLKQNRHLINRFKEKHTVRYFAVDEIIQFLQNAGFIVLGMHPFLNLEGAIRKNTWDITVVSKRA